MARHDCLPQTMTPENLADWIKSNKVEVVNHIEKFPLTEEEIAEFQRSSSVASRQIDKLKDTKKYFTTLVDKGTPYSISIDDHTPVSVTIPPTKGIKVLEANRKYADDQIEKGYKEEITTIYLIPWPEYEKMVAVDIEGYEWQKYSRTMSKDEVRQHGKPILSASTEIRDVLEEQGIEIERVEGKEVKLTKKDKKESKKMNLLEDENPFRLGDDEQPI